VERMRSGGRTNPTPPPMATEGKQRARRITKKLDSKPTDLRSNRKRKKGKPVGGVNHLRYMREMNESGRGRYASCERKARRGGGKKLKKKMHKNGRTRKGGTADKSELASAPKKGCTRLPCCRERKKLLTRPRVKDWEKKKAEVTMAHRKTA